MKINPEILKGILYIRENIDNTTINCDSTFIDGYSTEEEAVKGHDKIVAKLKKGELDGWANTRNKRMA